MQPYPIGFLLNTGELSGCQQPGLSDPTAAPGERNGTARPSLNEQINLIAHARFHAQIGRYDRRRVGAIYGLAVELHPTADLTQYFHLFIWYLAIRIRADVQ